MLAKMGNLTKLCYVKYINVSENVFDLIVNTYSNYFQPLQFTALSADNLSLAVDIARRDIKKLKQEEQQQQQQRSVSNARNGQQRGTVQAAVQSTRSGTVFTNVQETGSHDQPFRGRKPFTYSQAYQNKIKKFEQRPPFEVIYVVFRNQQTPFICCFLLL